MSLEQDLGPRHNSAANPLPAAHNRAEFRCRPGCQNWKQPTDIHDVYGVTRTTLEAETGIFPCRQGNADGMSPSGPRPDPAANSASGPADIRGLAEAGMRMIIVTHEVRFAREVADRIVFMDDGVIVEEGSPGQLLDQPVQEPTRRFLRMVVHQENIAA
jgi:hypothetical protein